MRMRAVPVGPLRLQSQNSRNFAVGVGTLHLDFPSRMSLPRFGGAFLVWQRNQLPRCELNSCGRPRLPRRYLEYKASAPPLSQRRGFPSGRGTKSRAPELFRRRNVKKAMMDPQAPPTGERGFSFVRRRTRRGGDFFGRRGLYRPFRDGHHSGLMMAE